MSHIDRQLSMRLKSGDIHEDTHRITIEPKNGSHLPQPEVGAFRQDAKVAKKFKYL
jgi:hypothetical protein